MEQNKLDIATYCKYAGAKVLHEGDICTVKKIDLLATPNESGESDDILIGNNGLGGWWVNISDCRLILKNVSDISDADARQLVSLHGWDSNRQGKLIQCYMLDDELIVEFETSRYRIKLSIESIDYLRKEGYNIDNLPESMWVDAKTFVTNKTV